MVYRFVSALFLLAAAALPGYSAVQCSMTAVPLQVSSEGLAEPVGEIVLQCGGAAPNAPLSGAFQVMLSSVVANHLDGNGKFIGITLSQETTIGSWTPLAADISPVGNSVAFQGFTANFNDKGMLALRFSGIRAEASSLTKAALQFTGNMMLMAPTSGLMSVAISSPALTTTTVVGTVYCPGPAAPETLNFDTLVTAGIPISTTRVTEGHAVAFVPQQNNATNGTRFLLTFTDIPEGARLLLPDAIAGNNAVTPTRGSIGTARVGSFNGSSHSLVLARVIGAAPDGSGGNPAFVITPGLQTPLQVSAPTLTTNGAYAVYEVVDADAGVLESAQIPTWILMPTDRFTPATVVHQSIALAPVSDLAGIAGNAPIPRYRAVQAGSDCGYFGDCADYPYPAMSVTPSSATTFTADSGGSVRYGSINIRNTGGGVLEWKATLRYRNSMNWITYSPSQGVDDYSVSFTIDPKNLSVGHYEADLIVTQINSPTGTNAQYTVPLVLEVTPSVRPSLPAPTISDIVTPVLHFGGQFAPGSLATILGTNFDDRTVVTVGGTQASMVSSSPTELSFVVPLTVPMERVLVVASNQGKPSWPFGIEIIPVMPDIMFIFNQDGKIHSEENPIKSNQSLLVHASGVRLGQRFWVKIHDRYIESAPEPSPLDGIQQFRAAVPADLPTMPSEVVVCATSATSPDPVCSYARRIFILQTK